MKIAEIRALEILDSRGKPTVQAEVWLSDGTRGTAHCTARLPGYVLRFSPVFTIKGDSLQVYMFAQKYDTPASGMSETLRFERAYQVVKHGAAWTAVREGHVPKEIRAEPR